MEAYKRLGTHAISHATPEGPRACHNRDPHMYHDDGLSVPAHSRLAPQQAWGGSENPKDLLSGHRLQIGTHRSALPPLLLGEEGRAPAGREVYIMDRQRRRPP